MNYSREKQVQEKTDEAFQQAKRQKSYPDLQNDLIKAYHSKTISQFTEEVLIPELTIDKFSRKERLQWGRFAEWVEHRDFVYTSTPLEHLNRIRNSMRKIQKLKPTDRFFVEKTYHVLDELQSWAKKQGCDELLAYADKNPSIWSNSHYPRDWFAKTHLEQDLDLHAFTRFGSKKWRDRTIKYCKQYRKESYELWQQLKGA